jgi:NitT/TauT family transport system substrate-binding protein
MKKLFSLLLSVFLSSSVILSCSKKESEKFLYGSTEIQELDGGACSSPHLIAYEKGFFAEEGVDVKLVSGNFETNKIGLASGKTAIATGDFQFFPSANEGLDIKIVAGLHEGCIKLVVPANSSINSVKDLAGKRIGVDEIGGTPMAVTSVALANSNISPTDGVQWVVYPLDQLISIADKGDVDAIALWDPFGTIAAKKGYKVLVDIAVDPLFKDRYCCFIYASGKVLRENPKKITAILNGLHKASVWIAEHPEEAAKLLIEKKYFPDDDPEVLAELLNSYKYNSHHRENSKNKAREDAVYFTDELKKTGFLPKTLDTNAFVNKLYFDINSLYKEENERQHQ